MTSAQTCDRSDLCAELAGLLDTEFARTYPQGPASRVLRDDYPLAAIADLSPLLTGHILIVPREHFLNFGQVYAATGSSARIFIDLFLRDYQSLFGDYLLLEHGSSTAMKGSACISHAHLHVVPLHLESVLSTIVADGLLPEKIAGWSELAEQSKADQPYFLCANAEVMYSFGVNRKMPSQYLRRVLGSVLGIPVEECDWAVVVRRQFLQATISAWKSAGFRADRSG